MKLLSNICLLLYALVQLQSSAWAETTPPKAILPPEVHEIAPGQVERYLVDHVDTLIIDVRTEEERRSRGYILNSLPLDYFHGQKTVDALVKLDKTKPCIVYGAIGGRAKFIAIEMHKLGFKNILLIRGGFNAWTADGQAIAR
ncbi:rhodanese-like domain-containing protein [Prosthecobacter sp.]|uniref:rhodanese-like domain-containing protein n=1 Tax=Prosthecobacter sp. TaxID=1965333 RepID=UPI001D1D0F4F|nr:rhodanese-like domain-containing protein [Prosthecobacter sp.]MCB1276398.1 rhodanese-like domain-containing protein [Prosthecobacter sp.]